MNRAAELARYAVENNLGGPFGAVVVKDGKIIGRGVNKVTLSNDPTAHAEVSAIRDACNNLGSFQLTGCDIYTSCEPCPMCLGAIMWARIDKLFYAADRNDASRAGFDDELFYTELAMPAEKRMLAPTQLLRKEANEVFDKWIEESDKITY